MSRESLYNQESDLGARTEVGAHPVIHGPVGWVGLLAGGVLWLVPSDGADVMVGSVRGSG